jgi:hypothetical protein
LTPIESRMARKPITRGGFSDGLPEAIPYFESVFKPSRPRN